MQSDTSMHMNSTALESEVITMIHTVVFGTHSIEINSTDFCIMKCKLEGTSTARFREKSLPGQLCLGAEVSWVVELPLRNPIFHTYLLGNSFYLHIPSRSYGLRQLVNTMAQKYY